MTRRLIQEVHRRWFELNDITRTTSETLGERKGAANELRYLLEKLGTLEDEILGNTRQDEEEE